MQSENEDCERMMGVFVFDDVEIWKKHWKWVWIGRYAKDIHGQKIRNIVKNMEECYKQIQRKFHNVRRNVVYHR